MKSLDNAYRPVKIRPFEEVAQPLRYSATEYVSLSLCFILVYLKCHSNLKPASDFGVFFPHAPLAPLLFLFRFLSDPWQIERGPQGHGVEAVKNLTTLLMTFNEIHKTCRNLQKKGERERERERNRGKERERETERKAAPPATKLTASRLDIWPLVIREVPDSVPLNLNSKSLFPTVLTPQCPTRLSPPRCFFVPPPPLSPTPLPRKYRSQNYITVLRLPPP